MDNLAVVTASEQREITLQEGLFYDFISFIDRSDKTTKTYLTNFRQFLAWMKFAGITQPTRADILSYRQYLQSEHEAIQYDSVTGWKYRTDSRGHRCIVQCKPNTVTQYLQSVCQFFKWTAAEGIYPDIAANIHKPKIDKKNKKESFTQEQVLTIENSIEARAKQEQAQAQTAAKDRAGRIERATEQGKRLYAMFVLATNCALRVVELHRLNIRDLKIKDGAGVLYIWGKGRAEPDEKKPLAPEVLAILQDYLNSRSDNKAGNSPLFVSTGNRSKGKRIAVSTISTMLKKAFIEAGYDSDTLTPHSCRHTAAESVLTITGDNIYTTQKYLRHTSPKTTEIYLHKDTEQQEKQIAQQLYKFYHGTTDVTDKRQELESILQMMKPEQIEQLTAIAKAMIK